MEVTAMKGENLNPYLLNPPLQTGIFAGNISSYIPCEVARTLVS